MGVIGGNLRNRNKSVDHTIAASSIKSELGAFRQHLNNAPSNQSTVEGLNPKKFRGVHRDIIRENEYEEDTHTTQT
jgi:hypothetical protein